MWLAPCSVRLAMSHIRAFNDGDVDAVAHLHAQVFPPDNGPAPIESYRAYFRDTFLNGPGAESGFSSLVCEDEHGGLSGFLGVVPVRMQIKDGHSIWATVCTQFCVAPNRR